jgi:hypothetical protein
MFYVTKEKYNRATGIVKVIGKTTVNVKLRKIVREEEHTITNIKTKD